MNISIQFGEYDFKKTVSDWNTDIRSKLVSRERPLVDGASLDNTFLKGREISIKGVLIKSTETALRTAFETLKATLNKGKQYLYLFDDRRILAAVDRFSWGDYPRTYNNPARCEYSIRFKAESPYWEDVNLITHNENDITDAEEGHTFTVSNAGKANVYPVITITANATINDLTLENTADEQSDGNGLKCKYQDPAFFEGDSIVIDCAEGTVKRGDTNTIRYFSGAFLKLLPGDNSLKYTGGNCSLKIEFRKRFL